MSIIDYSIGDFATVGVGYTGEIIGQFKMHPAERLDLLELTVNDHSYDLLELVPQNWEVYVHESSEGLLAPDGITKAKLGNPEDYFFIPLALHEIRHIQRIEEIAQANEPNPPSYTDFLPDELKSDLNLVDISRYMREEYIAWEFSLEKINEYGFPIEYQKQLYIEIETALMSYIDFFSLENEDNSHLTTLLQYNSKKDLSEIRKELLENFEIWKNDFLQTK